MKKFNPVKAMYFYIAMLILAIFVLFLAAGVGEAKGQPGYIVFCQDNPQAEKVGETWQVVCQKADIVKEVKDSPSTLYKGQGKTASVTLSCQDNPQVAQINPEKWRVSCERAVIIKATAELRKLRHEARENPRLNPPVNPLKTSPCYPWWIAGAECIEVYENGQLVAVPVLPLWLCEQWWELGRMCYVKP